MTYRRLSEQVQQISNPQRSDAFVKAFRDAVREGLFDAVYVPERFELPKQYSRRGSSEKYTKEAKEMVFEATPAFERWFEGISGELANSRRSTRVKPSLEAFEAGELDFKTLAEQTREKMEVSFRKGQALGTSRAKGRKTTARKRK